MPDIEGRFALVGVIARWALILTLVLLATGLVVTIALAVDEIIAEQATVQSLTIKALIVLAAVALAGWAAVIAESARALVANEQAVSLTAGRLERLETLAADQTESARKLCDLASMSEKAKSLLYREKEIETFRETINHELMRQDFAAAEALINQIDKDIGYAEEAQRLRAMVARSREATIEERLEAAIKRIEKLIGSFDWARALREAKRLTTLFPEDARVGKLAQAIHVARNRRKRDLLQAYGDAARKNDVERSIELLKELDGYLTPPEGAALAESARGVFKARLSNLGVQFAIHVADERWSEAVAAGEQIMREFPNSRMANEVREKMDALRARAANG